MAVEQEYELRLASGKRVTWVGISPEDAIRRYEACVAGTHVIAWRIARKPEVLAVERLTTIRILEPGDPGY